MLEISEGYVASMIEIAVNLFTDVKPLIALAIALPLGFWLARKVISLVRAR